MCTCPNSEVFITKFVVRYELYPPFADQPVNLLGLVGIGSVMDEQDPPGIANACIQATISLSTAIGLGHQLPYIYTHSITFIKYELLLGAVKELVCGKRDHQHGDQVSAMSPCNLSYHRAPLTSAGNDKSMHRLRSVRGYTAT